MSADLLILMSDVDGIYNKPPWEDGARLMHTYTSQVLNLNESIQFEEISNLFSICDGGVNRTSRQLNLGQNRK